MSARPQQAGLSIGQVVAATGLTERTVRWYTLRGLVPCTTTAGGHRRYTEEAIEILRVVRAVRNTGAGLDEAAKVLRDPVRLERVRFCLRQSEERHRRRVSPSGDKEDR